MEEYPTRNRNMIKVNAGREEHGQINKEVVGVLVGRERKECSADISIILKCNKSFVKNSRFPRHYNVEKGLLLVDNNILHSDKKHLTRIAYVIGKHL